MFSLFRRRREKHRPANRRAANNLSHEPLEARNMLATFAVANLNDAGAGSLRQAILDANSTAGADTISFTVAGSIQLGKALPKIVDVVDIDGSTAPGYASAPVVEVDFNGARGLQLFGGASGSTIQSLSLVDSNKAGLRIDGADNVVVQGNYIGLRLDGSTVAGNRGGGIEVIGAMGNMIGGTTAAERNVISGNGKEGIRLSGASWTEVWGNYIGTDATGTQARGNAKNGVLITGASTNNTVGGETRNVISGNHHNGVLVNKYSSFNTVAGNFIGTNAAGTAALGNAKDGVKLDKATDNLIGNEDAVSGIDFFDATDGDDFTQPVSAWQGIRAGDLANEYLLVGTSNDDGLLYRGTIDGESGTSNTFLYPMSIATSVYGPDNLGAGNLRMVGTYRNADFMTAPVTVNGFLFEGTTADLGTPGNFVTVNHPDAQFNYLHSTMGGLIVGNYDNINDHGLGGEPLGPGHAYIYDIDNDTFTAIVFPGAVSNTAYGIWHNGGTKFTIVGGYSFDVVNNFDDQNRPIGTAYMVDYDTATGLFTNWTSFNYPNGTNFVTHFEGISSVEKGVYTLNADSVQAGSTAPVQGSWITVRRNADGSFSTPVWVDLNFTGLDPATNPTSSNSVWGNTVVGVVFDLSDPFSYQATISTEFQLSNVISGNGGNGVSLNKAQRNAIAMNFIGTNAAGTADLGNAGNGILVTGKSSYNLIGGEATDGNNPTNAVFARPPQGNLISGNEQNGVLINKKSTNNQLSGNYIGTTATGNAALGNLLDGVAIDKSNGNTLLGCTFEQDPFVFYNVISANGGNGLRVTNSNDTTIQANFIGVGADNDTGLGNSMNGVLIEGKSTRTVMGGPIPLGNVVAANAMNGIYVKDKASEFTTYNTFCGLAAFSLNPNLGNGQDGMLITTTGSNILIRTNVITRNGDDGIEVSGKAKDVRIAGNIIGLNTSGILPMGNVDNGIEIGGSAQNIVVGGPQPSFNVIPRNTIGANGGSGVAIVGSAKNNVVSHSYIGLAIDGTTDRGNGESGVFIDFGSSGNTIGSPDPTLKTVISGNDGNGITLNGTKDNTVIGSYIGVAVDGTTAIGNGGQGVLITAGSHDNVIGSTDGTPKNIIANNIAAGILAASGNNNGFHQNSIYDNGTLGIDLSPGANNNQAAPLLTAVNVLMSSIEVTGTLTSTANSTFTLEFFASDANDASGENYLGTLNVTTNAAGVAAFTFTGPLPPSMADYITATATGKNDNTSEFSNAVS
jgi:hypothetical protein